MDEIFFDFVRFSLGSSATFRHSLTPQAWHALYGEACKQTLTGVLFAGVERLPKPQQPPRDLLLEWYVATQCIATRNRVMNSEAVRLCQALEVAGFPAVILKGQGISQLYPRPELRIPGDIDVWVKGRRLAIAQYIRAQTGNRHVIYHQMVLSQQSDITVEAHFTPSWMFSPLTNCRLQRFFRSQQAAQLQHHIALPQDAGEVCVPTSEFNRVYILVHIYRHLFGEGVGLRQLLDYYYVLHQGFSETERRQTLNELGQLGMTRFAAAVMWVMHAAFGLEDHFMLLPPNEPEGQFLLAEIMTSGNMGHYDPRLVHSHSALSTFWHRVGRNLRFVRHYPSEALCTPLFKIWHFGYRHWWAGRLARP